MSCMACISMKNVHQMLLEWFLWKYAGNSTFLCMAFYWNGRTEYTRAIQLLRTFVIEFVLHLNNEKSAKTTHFIYDGNWNWSTSAEVSTTLWERGLKASHFITRLTSEIYCQWICKRFFFGWDYEITSASIANSFRQTASWISSAAITGKTGTHCPIYAQNTNRWIGCTFWLV